MIQGSLQEIAALLQIPAPATPIRFQGISADSRAVGVGALFAALRGERFDGHQFLDEAKQRGATAALVEQPVNSDLPLLRVANTRRALGQLAAWWRQSVTIPLVAITGSNGKTTVKEMLSNIFAQQGAVLATRGNLNNDLGVPLTLFNLNAEHRYAVIEMGANHPGEIAYLSGIAKPDSAVITLCAPAHLEGFQSIEGVARAKGEIFSGLSESGIAVINADDQYADFWRLLVKNQGVKGRNGFAAVLPFSLRDHNQAIIAKNLRRQAIESQFTLVTPAGEIEISLPLPGTHNIMNALAAAACALTCGVELNAVKIGLETVLPVKGRLQKRLGKNGLVILDDTYNANPHSLNAALAVLADCPPPRWLALGDMLELGESAMEQHYQAGKTARAMGVEKLWAIGPLSQAAVEAFGEGGLHFSTHSALVASIQSSCCQPLHAPTLLVKGSRGLKMERVVEEL